MAERGTRNHTIEFGDYAIEVSKTPAKHSRDLKTEYVDREGNTVRLSGGGGPGSRTPPPDVDKAVRLDDERVVRLPREQLEAITEASKRAWSAMRVLETIDYRSVPTERIMGSFWLQPRAGTAKGLRMLTEALHASDRVAVVKWVDSTREKLGILRSRRNGRALMLTELAFANDFTEPDADVLLDDVEVGAGEVEAAVGLVRAFARKRGDGPLVDLASDEAVDARLALFERIMGAELGRQLEQSARLAERGEMSPLRSD